MLWKKTSNVRFCCHFKADIPLQFKHLVLKPSACWRPAESLQQLADVQVQLLHVEGFDQTLNNPNWLNLEEMTPFTKEHLIVLVLESWSFQLKKKKNKKIWLGGTSGIKKAANPNTKQQLTLPTHRVSNLPSKYVPCSRELWHVVCFGIILETKSLSDS